MSFFPGIQRFSLAAAGLFWRSRPRGTQGTRLYTVQVWVLAGLHGACSGRSKLRNLANNHGIAFRPAINGANRAHANPQNVLFIFHLSAAVFEVPQQPSKARQPRYNSRASSFSRCDSHERCFCVWVRAHACVYAFHCRILQGASPAAWKAAGRRLAYAQNVSDGVVKDGGET